MEKEFRVERDVIFFAMRYALGRKTFAPTTVIDNIKHNIHLLSAGHIKMLIRDIDEQASMGYGMQCDIDTWMNFKSYLEDKSAPQEPF